MGDVSLAGLGEVGGGHRQGACLLFRGANKARFFLILICSELIPFRSLPRQDITDEMGYLDWLAKAQAEAEVKVCAM